MGTDFSAAQQRKMRLSLKLLDILRILPYHGVEGGGSALSSCGSLADANLIGIRKVRQSSVHRDHGRVPEENAEGNGLLLLLLSGLLFILIFLPVVT